jgi:integrase
MTDKKSKPGPKRSGSLYMTKSGWSARIRVEVDGETVQRSYKLETMDRKAATAKLRRLVKMNAAPTKAEAKAAITCDEFAFPLLAARTAKGIAAAEYELRFYERVWSPRLGKKALDAITVSDIGDVLEGAAAGEIMPIKRKGHRAEPERYSRQSIEHMRATMIRILQAAMKAEIIIVNKAKLADIPEIDEERKVRAVLTDAEISQLVACPDVDAEIKMLLLVSRTVGGQRAGDLNALDWTSFTPGFVKCTFVRRKTRKKKPTPTTLVVPEPVRAFLQVWWEGQGCPTAGPVFPVRRGPRAGQSKKGSNMSYAKRLRRELLKARIDRHELHHETPFTLPVDFHSTRRAYGTALARADVNEQKATALTGHSDGKTHRRYLETLIVEVPRAALPELSTENAQLLRRAANKNHNVAIFPGAGHEARTRDPELGKLVLYQLS